MVTTVAFHKHLLIGVYSVLVGQQYQYCRKVKEDEN